MDTLPLLLFSSSALQHLLSWCWGSLKGVSLLSGSTWEVLPLQGRLKGLAATGQTAEWTLLHAHRRIKASGMKRAEPTQCLQRLPRRGGHFVHSLVHRLADQGQALATGTRPLPCGGPAGQGQPGRFRLSCPSTDRMIGGAWLGRLAGPRRRPKHWCLQLSHTGVTRWPWAPRWHQHSMG